MNPEKKSPEINPDIYHKLILKEAIRLVSTSFKSEPQINPKSGLTYGWRVDSEKDVVCSGYARTKVYIMAEYNPNLSDGEVSLSDITLPYPDAEDGTPRQRLYFINMDGSVDLSIERITPPKSDIEEYDFEEENFFEDISEEEKEKLLRELETLSI